MLGAPINPFDSVGAPCMERHHCRVRSGGKTSVAWARMVGGANFFEGSCLRDNMSALRRYARYVRGELWLIDRIWMSRAISRTTMPFVCPLASILQMGDRADILSLDT